MESKNTIQGKDGEILMLCAISSHSNPYQSLFYFGCEVRIFAAN